MPLLLLRPRGLLRRRLLSVSSALALALPLAPDSLDCSSAVSKGATTAAAPSTSGCVDCSWSVPTQHSQILKFRPHQIRRRRWRWRLRMLKKDSHLRLSSHCCSANYCLTQMLWTQHTAMGSAEILQSLLRRLKHHPRMNDTG